MGSKPWYKRSTYTFLAIERIVVRSQEHVLFLTDVYAVSLEVVRAILVGFDESFFLLRFDLVDRRVFLLAT